MPKKAEPSLKGASNELVEAYHKLRRGEAVEVTVRQFLGWFGAQRRGSSITWGINSWLKQLGIVTKPNYEFLYIDTPISLGLAELQKESKATKAVEGIPEAKPTVEGDLIVSSGFEREGGGSRTTHIGWLEAANNSPLRVAPDAPLASAITIMLAHDFSQLPVMNGDRSVKGAVSWKSIGQRMTQGLACQTVAEAMDKRVDMVERSASIFDVIERVNASDFVLVCDETRKVTGIVTTTDLGNQLRDFAQPFVIIGDIEGMLRILIADKFTADELKAASDPSDGEREIASAVDLTFGAYKRLLEKPENWNKLGLTLDRVVFIDELDTVRKIRNGLMHFDPGGLKSSERDMLGKFHGFLARLFEIRSS